MIIKNPKFEISAVSKKQYPENLMYGKSSFINTLINRKALARTSSEPRKN